MQYTAGSCNVTPQQMLGGLGFSIFGPACQEVSLADAPVFAPTFSCGIQVSGQSSCGAIGEWLYCTMVLIR